MLIIVVCFCFCVIELKQMKCENDGKPKTIVCYGCILFYVIVLKSQPDCMYIYITLLFHPIPYIVGDTDMPEQILA